MVCHEDNPNARTHSGGDHQGTNVRDEARTALGSSETAVFKGNRAQFARFHMFAMCIVIVSLA